MTKMSSIRETHMRRFVAVPYQSDLWRERYPMLAIVMEDEIGIPKRNLIRTNISAGGIWDDINRTTRQLQTITDNIVYDEDPEWVEVVKDKTDKPIQLVFKDQAAVDAIGFEELPLECIGVYEDVSRASWPVHHETRIVEFPEPPPRVNLPENPTYMVKRSKDLVTIDGTLDPEEWDGLEEEETMGIEASVGNALISPPARAWLMHNGDNLKVAMTTALSQVRDVGATWGQSDANELAL